MEQFSYAFITTLLHSIWQTALLLFIYFIFTTGSYKTSPLFKRNFLFAILSLQLLCSLFTFFIIYTQPANQGLAGYTFLALSQVFDNSWLLSNAPLFFWAYTFVVLYRIGYSYIHYTNFINHYKKSLIKPAIDLRLFTVTKAFHFGIKRKISLWCSNAITTPMTFGFLKPVILLPLALVNQLSLQQTEALIIHELTHIRNNDFLLNWLLLIMQALFFFNPFIHIIAKKIKIEREKDCDVRVLHFNYNDIVYAETLLIAAQYQQKQLSLQLAAVKTKKQLLERIHFFSDKKNIEFDGKNLWFITMMGLITIVLVNVLLVQAFTQKQTSKTDVPIFTAKKIITAANDLNKNITTGALIEKEPLMVALAKPLTAKAKRNPALNKIKNNSAAPATETGLDTEAEEVFYAMPASNSETLVEGKEMIIKDESSDGKKITAAFKALLINGVWTFEPLWMISETKPLKDSLVHTKDSVLKLIPAVQ